MKEIKPYSVYITNNTVVVALSTGHKLPYLADCVASQASGVGVDITDPKSYDLWEDAVLCWNVLAQNHEFHNPANLSELDHRTDGYIPFDHATGSLRAVLSLLKFAQDKLYENPIFETTLKMVKAIEGKEMEIKTAQTEINREQLLNSVGHFSWDFGQKFFVETPHGNFVWSDPDYKGDNTFTKFDGSYKDWIKQIGISYGRDKGNHIIRSYCGDQIVVK